MAAFDDIAAVVADITPGWPCVEYYRHDGSKRVIIRAVQGLRSDENTRRWVYQITYMGGLNDTAETVSAAADLLAKHFLDNHRAGGVLLITVVRDLMGPYWNEQDRPYYNFDISLIYTAT